MTLPAKFAERVLRDLGDSEGAALCAALDTEPPVSVRLNPAKCGGPENGGAGREEDADKAAGRSDGVQPAVLADADGRVPWCGDGYYLAARPQFTFDSDFHAGAYYVQEASSQFVGRLMGGEGVAGKRILDLCAAPGGKTTHIAELMENRGRVIAFDIHKHKIALIENAASRLGIDIIEAKCADSEQLSEEYIGCADRVLADVPCSGIGVIHKKPDIKYNRRPEDIEQLCKIQEKILENAARYLKDGGVLVYSTCTIFKDENEYQIERFLERHDEFEKEFEKLYLAHETGGSGFYICRMVKNSARV